MENISNQENKNLNQKQIDLINELLPDINNSRSLGGFLERFALNGKDGEYFYALGQDINKGVFTSGSHFPQAIEKTLEEAVIRISNIEKNTLYNVPVKIVESQNFQVVDALAQSEDNGDNNPMSIETNPSKGYSNNFNKQPETAPSKTSVSENDTNFIGPLEVGS